MMNFTLFEYMCYTMYIIPVIILIYERVTFGHIKQNLYPLLLYVIQALFRIYTVSVRHGTTPPRIYVDLYKKPVTKELLTENLMLTAWV